MIAQSNDGSVLAKSIPIQQQNTATESKLAIGMKKLATSDEIDEDDLLKDEKINLEKPKYESCASTVSYTHLTLPTTPYV